MSETGCIHGVSMFEMCWTCGRFPLNNKFNQGSGEDGKHYWLTPPELYRELDAQYHFDFDPCPCPKPNDFDGLESEWGQSNYVNPPFGSTIHNGRKVGPTAWAKKALKEYAKDKRVVLLYPIDKWILMLLAAGAEVRNLGDVRWCAVEDGTPGKGTGRHVACFVLEPGFPKATSQGGLGTPCELSDLRREIKEK